MERTATHDLIDTLLQKHDFWSTTTSSVAVRFDPARNRMALAFVDGKWEHGKEVRITEAVDMPDGAGADSDVVRQYTAYITEKFNIPWLRLVRVEHVVLEPRPELHGPIDRPRTALVMHVMLRDDKESPDVPERVRFVNPRIEAFMLGQKN